MYYKVVTENYESATTSQNPDARDFVVKYAVGEWTYPTIHGTKLFVYNNLAIARQFNSGQLDGRGRIFECEVKGAEHRYDLFMCNVYGKYFAKFLRLKLSGHFILPDDFETVEENDAWHRTMRNNMYQDLTGVVFVDAVKLLRPMESDLCQQDC